MNSQIAWDFFDLFYEYLSSQQRTGSISFHGGEPTLMGTKFFEELLAHRGFQDKTFRPAIQTNGTKIDNKWIDLFTSYNFSVGISFDGEKVIHDAHRKYAGGRGSYDVVCSNTREYISQGVNCGIICVANPSACGERAYAEIRALGVNVIDLLLPLSIRNSVVLSDNYQNGLLNYVLGFLKGWLTEASDVRLRVFDVLFSRARGKTVEYSGLGAVSTEKFLVLETDGLLHHDEDRFTTEFRNTKFQSLSSNLSDVPCLESFEKDIDIHLKGIGAIDVCKACKDCEVKSLCHSGMLASRFSLENGFDNPSVHCKTLFALCSQIQRLAA